MSEALKDRIESLTDWLKGIDTLRALVVSLLAFTFVAGGVWKGIDARLESNANDIKAEQASRQSDKAAIGTRLDRAVDKILDAIRDGNQQQNAAIKEVRENQQAAAERGTKTREDVSYIKGLLKQTYSNGG